MIHYNNDQKPNQDQTSEFQINVKETWWTVLHSVILNFKYSARFKRFPFHNTVENMYQTTFW